MKKIRPLTPLEKRLVILLRRRPRTPHELREATLEPGQDPWPVEKAMKHLKQRGLAVFSDPGGIGPRRWLAAL